MSRLRREDGFTLIELLVAVSIGTVVLLAAFTIVDQAMPAQNRVADRVTSQARGRTALEQVLQQLHSVVCVAQTNAGTTTYQTPFDQVSDDNQVTFYTQMVGAQTGPTNDPAIVNTFAPEKHVLSVSAGKLVDQRYAGVAGGSPVGSTWSWPTLTSTRVILPDVQPYDATTKYFTYFAANSGTAMTTPLAAADWVRVARVQVAFKVGPNRPGSDPNTYAQVIDSAAIALPTDYTDATSTAKGPQCAY